MDQGSPTGGIAVKNRELPLEYWSIGVLEKAKILIST
jgi:hypothetical protein